MSLRTTIGTVCLYGALLTLLGLAGILVSVSFVPYQDLKVQLDTLSFHGNAGAFTQSLHGRVVLLLRVAAAATGLLVVVVFTCRRLIAGYFSSLAGSFTALFQSLSLQTATAIRRESPSHLAALIAIVGVACVVRLSFLFQPMRYDEAYTFTHYASAPFYVALSNYSAPNNHLFHTFLVRISYLLLGSAPWALRLPALVAGILVIPFTYVVGRAFYGKQAGLLAAGLAAASSPLIEYSTNARGYSMVCLFFLLTLALAPRLLDNPSAAGWVSLALLSAFGLYTVPTMLYPFGIVMLWLFFSILLMRPVADRGHLLKGLLASGTLAVIMALLLYMPVLLVWGPGGIVGNQFVTPKPWDYLAKALPASVLSTWDQWNTSVPPVVAGVLSLGVAVSLVFHRRISCHRVSLVAMAILWVVPVVLVQRVVPYERVWLFLIPLFVILAAAGLVFLGRGLASVAGGRWVPFYSMLSVVLSLFLSYNVVSTQSVYWSEETGTLRDAEAITLWMKDHLVTGDTVFAVTPSYGPLEYYFTVNGLSPSQYWYSAQPSRGQAGTLGRMFVVVKEPSQSLENVLEKLGRGRTGYADPVLIQRYPGASLYEMRPEAERS